jgi:hypothetical protein
MATRASKAMMSGQRSFFITGNKKGRQAERVSRSSAQQLELSWTPVGDMVML